MDLAGGCNAVISRDFVGVVFDPHHPSLLKSIQDICAAGSAIPAWVSNWLPYPTRGALLPNRPSPNQKSASSDEASSFAQ
jgi:hypothetical protein